MGNDPQFWRRRFSHAMLGTVAKTTIESHRAWRAILISKTVENEPKNYFSVPAIGSISGFGGGGGGGRSGGGRPSLYNS